MISGRLRCCARAARSGAKEGTGTQGQAKVLDFVVPYLQLRDNLLYGVRTQVARPQRPQRALGYYYLPAVIYFWQVGVMPATP
jgi:hypothetical protein